MNTITLVSTTKNYWNILKHLNDDVKIDLIALLSTSLKEKNEQTVSASYFYGCWGDDGMDTDEFINELRESRSFNDEIVTI